MQLVKQTVEEMDTEHPEPEEESQALAQRPPSQIQTGQRSKWQQSAWHWNKRRLLIAELYNRKRSCQDLKALPLDSPTLCNEVQIWEDVFKPIADDELKETFVEVLEAHNWERRFTPYTVRDRWKVKWTERQQKEQHRFLTTGQYACLYCQDTGSQLLWQWGDFGWRIAARGCQCAKAGRALRKDNALGRLVKDKDGAERLEGDGQRYLKKKIFDEFIAVADVVALRKDGKPRGFPDTGTLTSTQWPELPPTEKELPF